MTLVFNYGGGRQTIAMCVMIMKEVLPRPDVIVMADTGRENPMTWEYLDKHVKPMLNGIGLEISVASHSFATVQEIYALNGDMILPAFTSDGKLGGFCSNEWKKRVVDRWLRKNGHSEGERWLGLAFDEKRRWLKQHNKTEGKWKTVCPLVDLMLNTDACLQIIQNAGLPQPHHSSCFMCPHKWNDQWRYIRDNHPEEFAKALEIDEEIRDHNFNERNKSGGKLFLHHSRVPLKDADLDAADRTTSHRECSLGMCFV
jgi:hypothetical protein